MTTTANKYVLTDRLVSYFESRIRDKEDEIKRIEGELSALYDARNVSRSFAEQTEQPVQPDAPEPLSDLDVDLLSVLRNGTLLDAIRFYREQTGNSLKDAKDYVEKLREQL